MGSLRLALEKSLRPTPKQSSVLGSFFRVATPRKVTCLQKWCSIGTRREEPLLVRMLPFARLLLLVGVGMAIGMFFVSMAFAADALPEPLKIGLPMEEVRPTQANPMPQVVLIIREAIKYVGVLAIMSLSWGGVLFLVSIGEDGKVKKAKSIILYSLLGVILSITAYTIIDIVNSLSLVSR